MLRRILSFAFWSCFAVLLFLVVAPAPLLGQVTTGLPPFGSFSGGPFDTVNNANLDVHFQIPVINKTGVGLPFYYILSYDGAVWTPKNAQLQPFWTPVSNWGWRAITEVALGYVSYRSSTRPCRDQLGELHSGPTYTGWSYHDPLGVQHFFVLTMDDGNSPCYPLTTNKTVMATDGSGYTLTVDTSTGGPIPGLTTARAPGPTRIRKMATPAPRRSPIHKATQ